MSEGKRPPPADEVFDRADSKWHAKPGGVSRRVAPWLMPRPICEAPKDRPILAWCDHEADPYVLDEKTGRLTLYAAHAEGMSHAPTGWHIVVWGGGFSDSPEDGGAWLPDWWFTRDSEFECAANPVWFYKLPDTIKP